MAESKREAKSDAKSEGGESKAALLAEAYKRGILPDDMRVAYEEALRRGLVGDKPAETDVAGEVGAVGAGFNRGLATMLGLPVDALNGVANLAGIGVAEPFGGSASIRRGLETVGIDTDAQAETRLGRVLSRGAEEVGAALVPMAGAAAIPARMAAGPISSVLRNSLAGVSNADRAVQLGVSGAAGMGAGAATEAGPQAAPALAGTVGAGAGGAAGFWAGGKIAPGILGRTLGTVGGAVAGGYAGGQVPENAHVAEFAGGLLGGAAALPVVALGGMARNAIAPLASAGGKEDAAGYTLRQFVTDPDSLGNAPDEIVPGSMLTTAQAAADPGLASLERTLRSQQATGPIFAMRDAERAAAQRAAMQGLAPEGGGAEDVAAMVRGRLGQFQDRTGQRVAGAQGAVDARVGALGSGLDPVAAGRTVREELGGARDTAKRAESNLWQRLQDNEDLALEVGAGRENALRMLGEISPSAKPPSGDAAGVLEAAANLGGDGGVVRWRELQDLRSWAAQTSSDLARAGDAVNKRRVDAVLRGLDDDIARAVGDDPAPGAGPAPSAPPRPSAGGGPAPAAPSAVYTPAGQRIETGWRLVDLAGPDAPVPSHTADFRVNPAYRQELQPRARDRATSEAQVVEIAGKLDPDRLGHGGVNDGAPIVGPDNMIESGNGRTLAIARAYRNGGEPAQRYRAWIEGQGFDTAGMKQPALVRVRTNELSDADRVRYVQDAAGGQGMRLSPVEQARVDGGRLSDDALSLYRGGSVDDPANIDLAREFVRQSAPGDANALATADGRLSVEGARRIQGALLHKTFGNDTGLVSSLLETGDDNIKALGRALTDAAPKLAQLRAAIARGDVPPEMDPVPALLDSVRVVQRARTDGAPIGDVLGQADAFNPVHPHAETFLGAAYGDNFRRVSVGRTKAALDAFVDEAMQSGGMFGTRATAGDAWAAAQRRARGVGDDTAAGAGPSAGGGGAGAPGGAPAGGPVEITREQRRQMLAAQGDVYAESNAPKSERVGRNGETFMAYDYSPELFLRSDLTGRPIRHYVRLPDGRIAHPDELFTSDRVQMAKEPNPQAEAKAAWRDAIKSDFLYTPTELGRLSEGAGVPVKEVAQIRREHKLRVAQAIEDGRQIPPAVLDLYPDLKARAKELEPAGVGDDAATAAGAGSGGGVPPGGGGAVPPGGGGGGGRGGGSVVGDGLTPNFGPEDAARYRAARAATAERKQTFDRGAPGQVLQQGGYNARGESGYAMPVEQVAGRFFNAGKSSRTDMAEFLRAAESRPAAVEALRDYAIGDLRRAAVDDAGRVDPKRWAAWVAKHDGPLRSFPEVRREFANIGAAQRLVDRVTARRERAVADFGKTAAGKFTDGRDADAAFASVINSGNRTQGLTQLVRLAKGDADKLGQLRRATVDHLIKTVENTGSVDALQNQSLSPAKTVRYMATNGKALQKSGLLTPGQIAVLRRVEEDMNRAVYVQTVGKAVGSPTYQNFAAGAVLGQLSMGYARHNGLLANTIGRAGNWIFKIADREVQKLVADAMLDPALARELMARATPDRMLWLNGMLKRRALATGLITGATADGE